MIRCYSGGSDYARIHVVVTMGSTFVETKCNRVIQRREGGAGWQLDPSNDDHLYLIARSMCSCCRRRIADQLVPW